MPSHRGEPRRYGSGVQKMEGIGLDMKPKRKKAVAIDKA